MTATCAVAGDLVMMAQRTVRGSAGKPRVVHQLARIKDGVAYPFVMACGTATTHVMAPVAGAKPCPRCVGAGAEALSFFDQNRNPQPVVTPVERRVR